jgi:hypothetical protein
MELAPDLKLAIEQLTEIQTHEREAEMQLLQKLIAAMKNGGWLQKRTWEIFNYAYDCELRTELTDADEELRAYIRVLHTHTRPLSRMRFRDGRHKFICSSQHVIFEFPFAVLPSWVAEFDATLDAGSMLKEMSDTEMQHRQIRAVLQECEGRVLHTTKKETTNES